MKIPKRRKTREVRAGGVIIGGKAPVSVQSMTCTQTSDIRATLAQIRRLAKAGCELVRVAVPDSAALSALSALTKSSPLPLVADIHFKVDFALGALEAGCDKIRINPGNLGGLKPFQTVLRKAAGTGAAIRIGVNSGSVEKDLLNRYGGPTPQAMVESALRFIETAEKCRFHQLVVSIKSSHAPDAVEANRLLSKAMDYPIHIGITEAGTQHYGTLKSAVGLGALLLDGIGDTLRVSLTGDPVLEIPAAFDILKAAGVRLVSPEVISCPTCGRLQYNMDKVAREIEKKLQTIRKPLRVAVMGCVVNGPGEAKEADIALAGGRNSALLFVRGKKVAQVREDEMVEAVIAAAKSFQ